MASRKRAQLEPTDDWEQLQFQLDWPEQTRYELIRPVVVFGAPPVERAKQTGVSARTIYRKVNRFDELGMQSLFEAEPVEDRGENVGALVEGEGPGQPVALAVARRVDGDRRETLGEVLDLGRPQRVVHDQARPHDDRGPAPRKRDRDLAQRCGDAFHVRILTASIISWHRAVVADRVHRPARRRRRARGGVLARRHGDHPVVATRRAGPVRDAAARVG